MIYAGQWVRHALPNKVVTSEDYTDPLYLVFAIDEPEESYDGTLPESDPYYAYRTLPTDKPYSPYYARVPGLGYRQIDHQRWKWHIRVKRFSITNGLVGDHVDLFSPPDIDLSALYPGLSSQIYGKRYYPRMRKGIYGLWQPSTNYVLPCRAPEKEDELCVIAKDGEDTEIVVAMVHPSPNDYCYEGKTFVVNPSGGEALNLLKAKGYGVDRISTVVPIDKCTITPYHAGLGKFMDKGSLLFGMVRQFGGTLPDRVNSNAQHVTGPYQLMDDSVLAMWLNIYKQSEHYADYYDIYTHQMELYPSFRDAQLAKLKTQKETSGYLGGFGFNYSYSPYKLLQYSEAASFASIISLGEVVACKPLAGNMICKFKMGGGNLWYDTTGEPYYGYRHTWEIENITPMPWVMIGLDCEKYPVLGTYDVFLSSPAFKICEFTLADNIDAGENEYRTITVECPDFCAIQHGRWTWIALMPKAMLDGDFSGWLQPHLKPVNVLVNDPRSIPEIESTMLSYVTSVSIDSSGYKRVKANIPTWDLSVGGYATFTNENTT